MMRLLDMLCFPLQTLFDVVAWSFWTIWWAFWKIGSGLAAVVSACFTRDERK